MKIRLVNAYCPVVIFLAIRFLSSPGIAADKLIGIHSARTMSQSMPWIADEVGLFKKYDLEFQLVFISSAAMVTAAMLSGDGEVAITGAESITRAFAQGVTELIFIASAKNTLTHSILGKAEIKRPEDLKGKKLGLTRLGSNSHYFVIQALRKYGMEPTEVNFIQTSGQTENLAALFSGAVDAATMTGPSGGARAISQGFRYVVYGPDLHIPFAAATLVARRSSIRTRGPVIERFVRVMAEAVKIMFTDKELTYKVLASSYASATGKYWTRPTTRRSRSWSRGWNSRRRRFRRSSMRPQKSILGQKRSNRKILSTGVTLTDWRRMAFLINSGREIDRLRLELNVWLM